MEIKRLQDTADIIASFKSRFVLSWEEFEVRQKAWIERMAQNGYPVDMDWYEQAYLWDKINPDFPCVSMKAALADLRERSGSVLFMAEKGEDAYYRGKKTVDFVAEADAQALAGQIEKDWFDASQAAAQGTYSADAFLPEDLYVFDRSMKWCVVFTHESTSDDSEPSAESRACILCTL